MTRPIWVAEAAESFWRLAGEEEAFPRALHRPLAAALPVGLVLLPRLRLLVVDDWLRRQAVYGVLELADRPLRACLIARQGQGLIFLDGTDPPDEQRFSLAHEVAHYLRDYWQPRQAAAGRLGPAILDVLDGVRPPRAEERIDALVARIPLGYHVHLLERTPMGAAGSTAIARAEHAADLLAYELFAPEIAVLRDLPGDDPHERRAAAIRCLGETYGLPPAQAAQYAARLVAVPVPTAPLLRRLGLTS